MPIGAANGDGLNAFSFGKSGKTVGKTVDKTYKTKVNKKKNR